MSKAFYNKASAENILIVDALNYAFSFSHRIPSLEENYFSSIYSIANSYSCGRVIIVADQGASRYRKEILPDYKISRDVKKENQSQEDKELFALFFDAYKSALGKFEEVYQYEGVEADDLAGWIVDHYDYNECWLLSSDKDWDQLVKENVHRFSYKTRKETTVNQWPYPYTRDQFIDVKAVMGDSGDDVPGVPGIGPKRAHDLIEQYGSVIDLGMSLPIEGSSKYIQALNDFGLENLERNLRLVDLHEFQTKAIGKDNIQDMKERLWK